MAAHGEPEISEWRQPADPSRRNGPLGRRLGVKLAAAVVLVGLAGAAWPQAMWAGSGHVAADRARADRIDKVLRRYRSPLAGLGAAFVRSGHKYRVSPEFVVSIAGVESTFGRAACGKNAWGIGSCSRSFRSWVHGIDFVTRMLREKYLDRGLTSLASIGRTYCPPCGAKWSGDVGWYMRQAFGVAPIVVDT